MADLAALLLRDYELHERRSIGRARAALAHLAAHFHGRVDPERAYDLTMRYVIRRRGSNAAPATIRYEVAVLGRALTLAFRTGLIRTRPYLARPAVHNARLRFVTPDELRALLPKLPQPIRDAALFAYVTGWRRAEVFGLTWDRVDFAAGVVTLSPGMTKNREGRSFPFRGHPQLRRMLERRALEVRRGPYVFGRENGGRVVTFDRPWKRACEGAGLGHTVFHDFKRSAVRNLDRAGVPRTVAMALVGHKTESIYRRYAIVNERDLVHGVRLLVRATSRGHDDEAEEESGGGGDGKTASEEVVREAPPRDR